MKDEPNGPSVDMLRELSSVGEIELSTVSECSRALALIRRGYAEVIGDVPVGRAPSGSRVRITDLGRAYATFIRLRDARNARGAGNTIYGTRAGDTLKTLAVADLPNIFCRSGGNSPSDPGINFTVRNKLVKLGFATVTEDWVSITDAGRAFLAGQGNRDERRDD